MKASIVIEKDHQDYDLTDMPALSWGVITASNGSVNIGESVVRVVNDYFFPAGGTWTGKGFSKGQYRYRDPRPGETLHISTETMPVKSVVVNLETGRAGEPAK